MEGKDSREKRCSHNVNKGSKEAHRSPFSTEKRPSLPKGRVCAKEESRTGRVMITNLSSLDLTPCAVRLDQSSSVVKKNKKQKENPKTQTTLGDMDVDTITKV